MGFFLIIIVGLVIVGVVFGALSKAYEEKKKLKAEVHRLEDLYRALDRRMDLSIECLQRIEQDVTSPADDARVTLELLQTLNQINKF